VLSWLVKRGRRDGPLIVLGVQCAAWAIFGTLKNLAPTATWALALHVGTSLFAVWAVTAAFTAISQITPNRLRGQMMALYTLLTGFVGVALGPLAVGLLTDNFFTDPRGIGPALAVVSAVGGTLGVLIPWLGRHAYRAAAERAAGAG
jgi:MFS-type transporter involved in bile tolerance (Atg22 family)